MNDDVDMFPFLLVLFLALLATFIFAVLFIIRPSLIVDKAMDTAEKVEDLVKYSGTQYPFVKKATALISRFIKSSTREHEAEHLRKQAELSELQSQINPHFLYNTLEAIRSECLISGVPEVAKMSKALAMFFRYSIDSKHALVSIKDELENVSNYFMIQQYRFDNKFSMDIILEDNDQSILSCMIPKLTIQPIIENSIYHGLETMTSEGKIEIRITKTRSRIIIIISDNGSGMNEQRLAELNKKLNSNHASLKSTKKHKTGIALTNVHQRLNLYFGKEYGLIVRSIEALGTDVEMTFPIQYDYGEKNEA